MWKYFSFPLLLISDSALLCLRSTPGSTCLSLWYEEYYDEINTKHRFMIRTGENRSTIEKALPSAAVSPTKLTRDQTRAFAVKDRRIIASAMANSISAVEIKSPYKRSPMKWYQVVSPSVCVCQCGSHWTIYVNSQIADFYGMWREIPNLVKTRKNIERFTWRAKYVLLLPVILS
jgi:hypothetical protein